MLVQSPYFICLCVTEEAFLDEMKRMNVKKPGAWVNAGVDATVHEYVRGDEETIFVCVASRHKVPYMNYALMVHEATHIWQKVRRKLGDWSPSDEFEAYSMQNLSERLMRSYDKLVGNGAVKYAHQ